MPFLLGVLMASTSNKPHSSWTQPLPGVWRAQIGRKDRPTLTEASRSKPKDSRLREMGSAELPFDLEDVRLVKTKDGAAVCIPLGKKEKVFGLGLQMQGSDRRGQVFHLRVDHYEKGQDRLHVPTPLYVSSEGYAVFLNTSRPVSFYVGVGNRLDDPSRPQPRDRNTDPKWDAQPPSSWVEASIQGPGLEVIVLAGPSAMDAMRRYTLFCGGGAMPPLWALGFWHRLPSLATAETALKEAAEFEARGFPLDVIGLEPGWQTRSYPGSMEWSRERFRDPEGFIRELGRKGIKVNLWENPYAAPGTDYFKGLQGSMGSHTVWLGAAPDILDPKARQFAQEFHEKHHASIGASGHKIDEVDGFDFWLWPDHAQFPSGLDGLQMRQIYGVLWQELLFDLYRNRNERTFGQVRGSNGGASRFPFAIYSDTYSHREYVTALTSSSLAGTLWCAEVRNAANPEEWVRRMQSACLSPIAQLNAWADGTKPWSFPSVADKVREAMLLRESLTPYLYTAFAQYWLDGTPPVRPMSLIDGGTETDQYLLGDNLLVAPMFVGEKSRKVRLPKGRWFDFTSGKLTGEDEVISIEPGLEEIPLFVRDGAAVPTLKGITNLLTLPASAPYTLRCYGKGPFKAFLFEDDGTSFAYEKGDYGLYEVTLDEAVAAAHIGGLKTSLTRKTEAVMIYP